MPKPRKPRPNKKVVDWLYVGIDPGATGAIAMLSPDGCISAYKLEEASRTDIIEHLMQNPVKGAHCAIEKNRSGSVMNASRAFEWGRNNERVIMACVAAGLPFEEVTPQKWGPAVGVKRLKGGTLKDEDRKIRKQMKKERAQELFPDFNVYNWNADALLLAEYCRRWKLGQLI